MKQFFLALALGLALCLPVLAVAVPASAHTLAHSIPAKCPHFHLKAHPSHVRDALMGYEFSVITGCNLNRNDTYDVFTSDDCMLVLNDDVVNTVQVDNEGRVNFAVVFKGSQQKGGCDPDLYIVTLRDEAANHQKAHVVIIVQPA